MRADFAAVEKHILDKLEKKLPEDLFYHGLHHTRDVYGAALKIAEHEGISEDEIKLLRIATFYHDAGFITHYKNHEEAGCDQVREELPAFGFTPDQIEAICGMIMATKIPQTPKNRLEEIICDADLDYLGRDDFKPIGQTLFDELKVYVKMNDEKQWNRIQLNFLKQHHYFTSFALKNRESVKQKHLQEIIRIVESYDE